MTLAALRDELRAAIRRLRGRPWHALAVIVLFALGAGASLTVLRIADAVLLHALPYPNAERMVRLAMRVPAAPTQELPWSDVGYRALEHRTRTLALLAGYRVVGVNLTVGDAPARVLSARVTGTFFELFGLPVRLGRGFRRGEESAKGAPVIVLSDALWRTRFGADRGVIGRAVRVDGAPTTIIGVADPRVAFPSSDVGYFTLMDLDAEGTAPFQLGIEAIALARPGVSLAAIVADASRIMRETAREHPSPHATPNDDFAGYRALVRPLGEDVAAGLGPTLALLGAAVLLVLVLTCVNVATLELVRSSERRTEFAVRAALGADRRRLIAAAMLDGVLQSLAGVLLGLALSAVAARALQPLVPTAVGGSTDALGVGVLVGALAIVAICAIASGAFPLAVTLAPDLHASLRGRGTTTSRRTLQVRRTLLGAQVAFACILVDGAALMVASVREAQRVEPGFRAEGLVTFGLSLPSETYPDRPTVTSAYAHLAEELRSVPGVTTVALTSSVPLGARIDNTLLGVEGRSFKADGTDPDADWRLVSASYFAAMGVRLVRGRIFGDGERWDEGTPVVVSASLAALLFPDGGDPIGHRIRIGPYSPWMPIVGVVADAKNRSLVTRAHPEMYLPYDAPRSPMPVARDMSVVVRADGPLAAVQAAVERIVRGTNPDLPAYDFVRFADVMRRSQMRAITTMRTLVGLAVAALLLAVFGSYALLSFAVQLRARELALRLAVGATGDDLVLMIGRETGLVVLSGIAAGLAGSLALSRGLAPFLFGVAALDARVTALTIVIVALAGFAAALVPAMRAGASDLMVLLRAE